MKFDFYMTLPSNSSMEYYPDNSATQFITHLPHEWRLTGEWVVGLSEIQFPQTFLHIPAETENNYVGLFCYVGVVGQPLGELRAPIKSGVYQNIESFLSEVNNAETIKGHLLFELDGGRHVTVTQICNKDSCRLDEHKFSLAPIFCRIMGFDEALTEYRVLPKEGGETRSQHPAALANASPSVLFVYTDICESHVTGDVQTPLLRVVPVMTEKCSYGSMRLTTFPNPKYLPLLTRNFNSIEINIRDEFGQKILFDHGTLTVTLHFKRID